MATIYNSDLSKEMQKGAGLQVSKDTVPNQLAEKVVPVMEVNPKLLRVSNVVANANAVNATAATVYTTPTTRDFYLCGAMLSVIKDVTATSTASVINGTVNGAAVNFMSIAGLTLTTQNLSNTMIFNPPIKLDRNTAVQVTNTTNVANVTARAHIFGYIDDVSNI